MLEAHEVLQSPSQSHYLTQVAEAETRFLTMLATDDPGLELVLNRENVKVYSKDTQMGFLLRSEWVTKHPAETFIRFLSNIEVRKVWDKTLDTMKEVEQFEPGAAMYYKTYKKVLGMSKRDIVFASRCKPYHSGWIDVSTSVTHPEYPEISEMVRIQMALGGYYACPLATGQTQVIGITECSFGGVVPKAVVKAVSTSTIPGFAKDVEAALTQYQSH